ncbi:MAG: biopolymer transporter ExbD [Betaproteobacteria bacterium]|nr:biopolymer transporter ExbD [Betaproteobacteria bacterium]
MAFGRLQRRTEAPPLSEINVTPLVDVMLVLLVIFMLTAPLLTSAVRLDLPSAEAPAAATAPAAITLALNAKGEPYLNDRPVTLAQLRERLQAVARANPETELQLRADQSLAYGQVVEVMALVQKAGLSRIGFVAQPPR